MGQNLLLVEKRKRVWCLLGWDRYKRPTYACGTCFLFRFTLTKIENKSKAPSHCPRCGASMGFEY